MWGRRCPVCEKPIRKCWCPSLNGNCPICNKPFPCLDH